MLFALYLSYGNILLLYLEVVENHISSCIVEDELVTFQGLSSIIKLRYSNSMNTIFYILLQLIKENDDHG